MAEGDRRQHQQAGERGFSGHFVRAFLRRWPWGGPELGTSGPTSRSSGLESRIRPLCSEDLLHSPAPDGHRDPDRWVTHHAPILSTDTGLTLTPFSGPALCSASLSLPCPSSAQLCPLLKPQPGFVFRIWHRHPGTVSQAMIGFLTRFTALWQLETPCQPLSP